MLAFLTKWFGTSVNKQTAHLCIFIKTLRVSRMLARDEIFCMGQLAHLRGRRVLELGRRCKRTRQRNPSPRALSRGFSPPVRRPPQHMLQEEIKVAAGGKWATTGEVHLLSFLAVTWRATI